MKSRIAPIYDFLIACLAFTLFGLLPNKAHNSVEFILFFYPNSIGFLPLLTVLLRITSSYLFGQTIGEKLSKMEKEKRSIRKWLKIYSIEICFVILLFALETIPESLNLFGFIGFTIEPMLEAQIKMPALFLSVFVIPMTLIFLFVFGIRTQINNSNQALQTTSASARRLS